MSEADPRATRPGWLRRAASALAGTTRRTRWIAFGAFAVALAVATHWPRPEVLVVPVSNLDKVAHFLAYGLWTLLLIACGPFGPPASSRNVALSGASAMAYSAIDEATQAIPGIGRTADILDYGANVSGILVACLTAWVFRKSFAPRG